MRKPDPNGKKLHAKAYKAWDSMLQRCTNPNSRRYGRYGGRGITVCPQWRTFAQFLADMGDCPEGLTLDRINNDGNYEPGNCRWTDYSVQRANSSNVRRLTHNGETKTLSEWAEHLGITVSSLSWRLDSGWPLEQALTAAKAANRK